MTPAVSAVCVSYNCADLLAVALASLKAQVVPGGFEVIVVDNASSDDSAGVAARVPGVTVVPLEKNVGFAAANNVGARLARGEQLLFVNPDVDVPPGVVAALGEFLAGIPTAAAVGPKVVGRDGRLQKFCARKFPTLLNLLVLVSGLAELRWVGSALAHRYYPTSFYERGPAPVEALSGAFTLVARRAFEAAGGFDENYFLYAEDLDLCRRLRRAGGEIWYLPVGPVGHYTGGSRRVPDAAVVVASHRAAARYARRWHGRVGGHLVAACSRVSLCARRLIFYLGGLVWKAARRRARFYADVLAASRGPKEGQAAT
ncbi:MAG: glycosyltransferase [candidate division Zixibacteria bacterium]|nr:glycosyltransferase [candidate division Zixibacteria bacterium]